MPRVLLVVLFGLVASTRAVLASEIPRANTPAVDGKCGGVGSSLPPPVLSTCTEPVPAGVPNLAGTYIASARGIQLVERIEQCGLRFTVSTVTPNGFWLIHDFLAADGTVENGCDDFTAAAFPDCKRIVVFGNFSGDCMSMYATPDSHPDVADAVKLGARRCLQSDGTIELYNMELVQRLGNNLVYEPASAAEAEEAGSSSQRRAQLLSRLPVVLVVLLLLCCCGCTCCYCRQKKRCCFAPKTDEPKI